MTGPALPHFAPETAAFYLADPDASFARLRREDPVHWYEPGGFWCITRHADVQEISRRPRLFQSGRGTQIFQIALANAGEDLAGDLRDSNVVPNIIMMDPPAHNRHRKLVMGAFTPRAAAKLEGRVREIARACLSDAPRGEALNFVDAVAVPVPMLVIAELLGVPSSDQDDFRRWSDGMIRAGAGIFDDESRGCFAELFPYLAERVRERRADPRDDIISVLVDSTIDGERLSDPEIVMFLVTLLVAGNETTRNLIAGGTKALLDHPDELRRLVDRPALLPNAIEEMLRIVSPVRNFCRSATRETELRGKSIAEGEFVVMFYGSANRDEEVFGEDAGAFRIERASARQHVAFGFGEHLCLGASLARLEARVMFEELLPLLPKTERHGPGEPLSSSLMNGWVDLPLSLPG